MAFGSELLQWLFGQPDPLSENLLLLGGHSVGKVLLWNCLRAEENYGWSGVGLISRMVGGGQRDRIESGRKPVCASNFRQVASGGFSYFGTPTLDWSMGPCPGFSEGASPGTRKNRSS